MTVLLLYLIVWKRDTHSCNIVCMWPKSQISSLIDDKTGQIVTASFTQMMFFRFLMYLFRLFGEKGYSICSTSPKHQNSSWTRVTLQMEASSSSQTSEKHITGVLISP